MNEIKCPNCQKVFQVDESGYTQILKQVHDAEFDKELEQRRQDMEKEKTSAIEIAKMKQDQLYEKALSDKDREINEKDKLISELKSRIDLNESEKKLAINEAVQAKEKELGQKESEITELQGKLKTKDVELELKEKTLKESYDIQLKMKDEQIEYYKDFKAKQSTKMVGESLEQHCLTQFNQIRMTAFPTAYFDKDNDAKSGSKGDFIFRECSEEGVEFISIMFEMKTEMDTTATKHKNEDFFKELDKDRREKNCEYAVLVSLLEADSELYNGGIVDVSYKYEKMYVIRPQFFIPMITLLRNAALNSLEYKKELVKIQSQQLDLYNFEENLAEFKNTFTDSFRKAHDRYADAIDGIDKAISQLTKIRENLVKSENHLSAANNKIEAVTVRKLTKNAPSVKQMLDDISEHKVIPPVDN